MKTHFLSQGPYMYRIFYFDDVRTIGMFIWKLATRMSKQLRPLGHLICKPDKNTCL